jgi:peptidoglycan/LPS O-acetylase OafA/YrhL
MTAAALYLANFDFAHPWFLGHLWSLSVEEQFYFLWLGVLKKWHRHRVTILVGVVAFAPLYRVGCHFLGVHGPVDGTFPAVADVLAIGCLLTIFKARMPKIKAAWAFAMIVPVVLVPIYLGLLRFHVTPLLLFVLWPMMHFSIAGLVLHVMQRPYWILNARPVVWLGKISYSLYLWQQLFAYGERHRPWYFIRVAIGLASASYYFVEQPMLRLRERRTRVQKVERQFTAPPHEPVLRRGRLNSRASASSPYGRTITSLGDDGRRNFAPRNWLDLTVSRRSREERSTFRLQVPL